MLHRVYDGWIAKEWIVRPESAATDWPARELQGHALPVPLAVRVTNARNVIGRLTLVTADGLQIDHGEHHVPFGIVRAYAILHDVLEGMRGAPG